MTSPFFGFVYKHPRKHVKQFEHMTIYIVSHEIWERILLCFSVVISSYHSLHYRYKNYYIVWGIIAVDFPLRSAITQWSLSWGRFNIPQILFNSREVSKAQAECLVSTIAEAPAQLKAR